MVTVAVLLVASGVLANRLHERAGSAAPGSEQGFVAPSVADGAPPSPTTGADGDPPLWGGSIPSVAALNQEGASYDAVFLLLPAEGGAGSQAIKRRIEAAERVVRGQGKVLEAFTLEPSAPEYAKLTDAYPAPCVLAMVRGASAAMVSGKITEASLMEGYVKASRPRSPCCPTGSNGKCTTK